MHLSTIQKDNALLNCCYSIFENKWKINQGAISWVIMSVDLAVVDNYSS